MFACCYGPRDKTNPDHWNCKMRGGPRAEWWAVALEGAARVLDVGCGFGFPSFYLASCGYEVVGVDPSPSQIAVAERYRRQEGQEYRLAYLVIDEGVLPFEDDSFDGAAFGHSLECVGDAGALISEVIRVLKAGSRVAIEEEDRSLEPSTHPVWEEREISVVDGVAYLWVETRVRNPYLDRRYLLRLDGEGPTGVRFRQAAPEASFAWTVPMADTGLALEEVLCEVIDARYGEAVGYDPNTLKSLLEDMGFQDLTFWARIGGRAFALALQEAGVLAAMPDDIRSVSRAMVTSVPRLSRPSTLVSCRSP
jgi:ubiquinone/menaquinone biosynthesis C-methylase UbiE